MSRICDFIIQKEELNPGEKAEIRDEQEKDLAYQKWLDSREAENELKVLTGFETALEVSTQTGT